MAVRLVCRACGKRLKLPDEMQPKSSAKCPKCMAAVDLTPVLESAAYKPTALIQPATQTSGTATKPAPSPLKPATLIGDDDPLPYPAETKSSGSRPSLAPPPLLPSGARSGSLLPPAPKAAPLGLNETPLSLDDDPDQENELGVAELPPFRVPVQVLTDSQRQIVGPCFAVVVPHGVFLEHEPAKPFLYVPVGCEAESLTGGELVVVLPDRRTLTLRFESRAATVIARDTRDFLAGERPAPLDSDYRLQWWMFAVAFIFALGLSSGPLVLSQMAELGLEVGVPVAAGFAVIGLIANIAVMLFSRRSFPIQMLKMAGLCLLVTGIFLFGATAYLAGWQKATEQAKREPPAPPPTPPTPPEGPPKPPEPAPEGPPSHLDRAKKYGSSALADGPAEITALGLAADNNTLGIGHADGTTLLWPLNQAAFDAIQPGPKADDRVLHVQFDQENKFIFAHTASGVFAAPRIGPPAVVAKIPGTSVAIAPQLINKRVRFAAIRGNNIQHRLLAEEFIQSPPVKKDKLSSYALPGKSDEIIPGNVGRDPPRSANPTFFAWAPDRAHGNRLFMGQPNGAINIWGLDMIPAPPNRDHKATVKTWASCFGNGDFATGDEKGNVALWPAKEEKPIMWPVFDGTAVTGLSFNATGSRLAVTDSTGWLVIWDTTAGKAIHRIKRQSPVKVMIYGPNDDVIILGAGRTAQVWWLPELVK